MHMLMWTVSPCKQQPFSSLPLIPLVAEQASLFLMPPQAAQEPTPFIEEPVSEGIRKVHFLFLVLPPWPVRQQ